MNIGITENPSATDDSYNVENASECRVYFSGSYWGIGLVPRGKDEDHISLVLFSSGTRCKDCRCSSGWVQEIYDLFARTFSWLTCNADRDGPDTLSGWKFRAPKKSEDPVRFRIGAIVDVDLTLFTGIGDWNRCSQNYRNRQVKGRGVVVDVHDSHGLCYDVYHDGVVACYDHAELQLARRRDANAKTE